MTTLETNPATSSTRTVKSVCNLCEAICGVVLTLEGPAGGVPGPERVTSIKGNTDDPLSRGHICPKGTALADVYEDPDRLRRPIRRIGIGDNARWTEIGWDEAIELAVTGLTDTALRYGADSVGVYAGNPNVHSLGSMTHGTQLLKTFGSKNVFSATSVDQLPHQLMGTLMFGHQLLLPVPDIDRTKFFLVFGANPMASNGSLMTVPDFPNRLRALKKRGGKMVVFDPRRSETARQASEHFFVTPGTDAFVLLAMVHTIFTKGLESPAPYLRGIDEVRAAVAPFTPQRAEAISGVPAGDIERIAVELATSGASSAYGRMGVSTQEFGSVCAWAINTLNALTGNLDRVGGSMFTSPAVDLVGKGLIGRGHHGKWHSRVRRLPETGSELPVSTLGDEILTAGEGQIRAMLTLSGNPILSTPDGARLRRGFEGLDFCVAVDIYLNETTKYADVILPPTSALERDHYDVVFAALGVRNVARFHSAVFNKPAGARHDWEIYRDLVLGIRKRLGLKSSLVDRVKTEGRLRLSPSVLIDALLRTSGKGLSVGKLRKNPDGIDLGALEPRLPERLMTKDKLIHLNVPLVMADLERLSAADSGGGAVSSAGPLDSPTTSSGAPLRLIGRRHQRDCNSWLHNTTRLTKGKERHHILLNPEDADERGIVDGAQVTVTSRVGSVTVEASTTSDMMRGVVSLPHGYGHVTNPGQKHARSVAGVSINDLTDPEFLDVSGNAALSGVLVEVRSAD